jgi:biopolymer transport protein ExbD
MAMSVGGTEGEDTPMSDINTTPLVDVMLVLLIIFLITVPITLQTVPVQLPKVEYEPTVTKPENVNLCSICERPVRGLLGTHPDQLRTAARSGGC